MVNPQPPVALTIAGSDSGGGAGIQADVHTFAALGVHGASALTAVTAQNTVGVRGVHQIPVSMVAQQLDAVFDDFDVAAAKTGMLGETAVLDLVAARRPPRLVVDPVMISTSGAALFRGATSAYLHALGPAATVFTPNLPEAETLLGQSIGDIASMRDAARELAARGPRAVVVTGGHADDPDTSTDVVCCDGEVYELASPRVSTPNTHGTGCTFSAAIAACLARGMPVLPSIQQAKSYVTRALAAAATWRLGAGAGPPNHFIRGENP